MSFLGDFYSEVAKHISKMLYTHKLPTARDEITLEILDTTSQPPKEILEKHLRWGDGFIFIYSLIEKASVSYLSTVKDMLEKIKGRDCPMVLVGNKYDLMSAREFAEPESIDLGQRFDCAKFEISVADDSQGVFEAMDELMCQIKREFIKSFNSGNVSPTDNKPRSKLYSMKKAFKKRINRSHSDTF